MIRFLGYLLLLSPLLGYSIGFNPFVEKVYTLSEETIAHNGHWEALGYEKSAALASEPIAFEVSSRRIRADDSADNGNEYGMMVDWTFKMPALKRAQAGQWDVLRSNVGVNRDLLRRKIEVGIKRDWLLTSAANERAKIFGTKVETSEYALKLGEKKYQSGRLSKMELLRLETEEKIARAQYKKALMEAEHFQHRLQEMSMMRETVKIDDLEFSFLAEESEGNTLALIERAPSIERIRMRLDEISSEIETLRNSGMESFAVGIGATQEPTQNSLDVRISFPLVVNNRNDQKIAALMSERSALIHQKEIMEEKLKLSLEAMKEHLRERKSLVIDTQKRERQYEDLYRMGEKGWEGGVVTQFEYLVSKNNYYDAKLQTIEIQEEYIQEMYEIEDKLGRIIR